MIELPLIFVAGVLGSSHCIGMCGPFALLIGSAHGWRQNAARQLGYTAGRVFTYSILGSMAGYVGWRLANYTPLFRNAAALLAILAGMLLLYQGLLATGLLRRRGSTNLPVSCLAGSFFATFLKSPGWTNIFLAGLFTGLLPCGLVYGFLALAASSGDLVRGASLMCVFGLGTAPVMVLTGCGRLLLSLSWRKRLYRAAAWCVLLTGVLSIARGAGFIQLPGWNEPAGCPVCRSLAGSSAGR